MASAVELKWKMRVFVTAVVSMLLSSFIAGFLIYQHTELIKIKEEHKRAHGAEAADLAGGCIPEVIDPDLACINYTVTANCNPDKLDVVFNLLKADESNAVSSETADAFRSALTLIQRNCDIIRASRVKCELLASLRNDACEAVRIMHQEPPRDRLMRDCSALGWEYWFACGVESDEALYHYTVHALLAGLAVWFALSFVVVLYPSCAPMLALLFCPCVFKAHGPTAPVDGGLYEIHRRCCCLRWMFREQLVVVEDASKQK